MRPARLSPLAKESHQTGTKAHKQEGCEDSLEAGFLHVGREHELVCHKLNKTSVDEDTCTDAVEDTVCNQSGLTARSEGLTDTETDGNGDGSADSIASTEKVRRPAL